MAAASSHSSDFNTELFHYYRLYKDEYLPLNLTKDAFLGDSRSTREVYVKWFKEVTTVRKVAYDKLRKYYIYADKPPFPATSSVTLETISSLLCSSDPKKRLKKTIQCFDKMIIMGDSYYALFLKMKATPQVLATQLPEIGTSFYHLVREIYMMYQSLVINGGEPSSDQKRLYEKLKEQQRKICVYPFSKTFVALDSLFS